MRTSRHKEGEKSQYSYTPIQISEGITLRSNTTASSVKNTSRTTNKLQPKHTENYSTKTNLQDSNIKDKDVMWLVKELVSCMNKMKSNEVSVDPKIEKGLSQIQIQIQKKHDKYKKTLVNNKSFKSPATHKAINKLVCAVNKPEKKILKPVNLINSCASSQETRQKKDEKIVSVPPNITSTESIKSSTNKENVIYTSNLNRHWLRILAQPKPILVAKMCKKMKLETTR